MCRHLVVPRPRNTVGSRVKWRDKYPLLWGTTMLKFVAITATMSVQCLVVTTNDKPPHIVQRLLHQHCVPRRVTNSMPSVMPLEVLIGTRLSDVYRVVGR